jgi:hypothetical protein
MIVGTLRTSVASRYGHAQGTAVRSTCEPGTVIPLDNFHLREVANPVPGPRKQTPSENELKVPLIPLEMMVP